jgi:hypothetical protein
MIERTDFDDAGVVNQNVNPVEMIDDFPDSNLNLIPIEQIAFDGENFSAARSDIGFGAGEFFWITREESNLSALVANVPRQHETKSARSATNQGNLVAQLVLRRAKDASGYPTAE